MSVGHRWLRAAISGAENLPIVRQLEGPRRRKVAIGLFVGAAVCMLLGASFGAANRGIIGTVIGAVSGAALGACIGAMFATAIEATTPSRHADARITISLDREPARYGPGDKIVGRVKIVPQNTFRCAGGQMHFVCRGFYAHDETNSESGETEFIRDSRKYLLSQQQLVIPATLRQGVASTHEFEFAIPEDALPTHQGYTCSVRWTLHCVLDASGDSQPTARQEVYVEARPPAVTQSNDGFRSDTPAPECELSLLLPRAVYAEGEELEAQIRITPLETFGVEEIRALLLRIENTPQGANHSVYIDRWDPTSGTFHGERQPGGRGTTYVWLEQETQLCGPRTFQVAESSSYDVKIYLPAQWRPTFATKDGRVTWKLGVVVDRGEYPDLRVFHEIIAHTGIPEIRHVLAAER